MTDFAEVQRLLATAAVALAPYEMSETSFSRFADPGKLKAYLAAGLPILLTPVPPNADELADHGGATVLPPDPEAFADAVCRLLDDPADWERRHGAAVEHSLQFDWSTMLRRSLPRLGIAVDHADGRSADA